MHILAKEIVFAAIQEINENADDGSIIENVPSTALLASGSNVDSLTLVTLLVAIERLAEEKAGKVLVLVDESAFEAENSPFATVESVIRHLERLLAQ
jgi:hypothetical protein